MFNKNLLALVGSVSAFGGTYELKPKDQCDGICMCMGDADTSGITGGTSQGKFLVVQLKLQITP